MFDIGASGSERFYDQLPMTVVRSTGTRGWACRLVYTGRSTCGTAPRDFHVLTGLCSMSKLPFPPPLDDKSRAYVAAFISYPFACVLRYVALDCMSFATDPHQPRVRLTL